MSSATAPRVGRFPWAFPVLVALAAGAALVIAQVPAETPRLAGGGSVALDGPALSLLRLVAAAVLGAALSGLAAGAREAEAYAVLLAGGAALAWTAAAATLDLAVAAVLWAAGWILAAAAVGRTGEPERIEAAVKLQGLGAAATLILLLGAALGVGLAGSTHVLEVGQLLGSLRDSELLARATLRVLLVGGALAAAWVPFHLWAPDGLSAAPRPVALVLAVAAPLAAALAVARLLYAFEPALQVLQIHWQGALFAFAALTALVGGSIALAQRDAARLTAYFTIVQCAELIPALAPSPGAARLLPLAAAAHLAALLPVWMALGAWSEADGEPTEYARLAGRGRARPVRALLWLAALALAAGFPGGARFVLRPALAAGNAPSLVWPLLLALTALMQWAVVVRLARVLFMDAPEDPGRPALGGVHGRPTWPAWALVAVLLALGVGLVASGRWLVPGAASWRLLLPGG